MVNSTKATRTTRNGAANGAQHPHTSTFNGRLSSVADVAAQFNLTEQPDGTWRGPNPFTGEGKDRFVLFPDGNATERGGGFSYTSNEVARQAGISPDQYEPCGEYRARNGRGAQVPQPAPKSPKAKPKASAKPDQTAGAAKPKLPKAPFDWRRAQLFDYTDEAGNLLFQVGRCDKTGHEKSIRQRQPDGAGGWLPNLDGIVRALYNLPDVMNANQVIILEGEGKTDALNADLKLSEQYGHTVATTASGGGGNAHHTDFAPLEGKRVVILPDENKVGQTYCDKVLNAVGASAECRVVELPDRGEGGDYIDFKAAGGTLEQVFAMADEAPVWKAPAPERRFPRFTLAEIFARPRLEYLLQGMFVEIGTGVISADYGGFKSFIALDMGLCIATGRDWMDRATKRSNVVYVTPEGSYTIADRVKAWMIRHNVQELPANFEIIELPVQLADATQRQFLLDELRELNPAFIIFDTVAKCNVGRDENDNAAMGEFTHGMEEVARELEAFVLAIHHNNKQGGTRGAVSLPANVDASITLKRSTGRVVTLHCDRVKGAPFDDFSLIGRIVEIGEVDENGVPVTSLVFEPTDTPAEAIPQIDRTRERILRALENAGPDGLTASKWQDEAGVGRSTLAEHRAVLMEEKRVEWDGRIYKVAIMSGTSAMSGTNITDTKNTSAMSGSTLVPDVADIPAKKRRARNSADAEPYQSLATDEAAGVDV